MPRGLILVRADLPWRAVRAHIAKLPSDIEFTKKTGAVIESWVAAMGAADFGVLAYAVSIEALRAAAAQIRDDLAHSAKGNGVVTTNTVIGSTLREQFEPIDWAEASMSMRLKELKRGEKPDAIRRQEAHRCFMTEQADLLMQHLQAWNSAKLLAQNEKTLLAALEVFAKTSTPLLQTVRELAMLAQKSAR